MQFEFATTPRAILRPGAMRQPQDWIGSLPGQRIFLITDPGLLKAGVVSPVVAALEGAGLTVTVYSEVEADPPETRVLATVAAARAATAEVVVGLGGGSSMDTAKLVALLVARPRRHLNPKCMAIGLARGPRLPLIQVPTTAGTGSEVTPISIVTTPSQPKRRAWSLTSCYTLIWPLLDAELTLGLPPVVDRGMTGIDAMVHAIEAYTSKLKKNPLSDSACA
jgi:alcohol dehydrogenase class IV